MEISNLWPQVCHILIKIPNDNDWLPWTLTDPGNSGIMGEARGLDTSGAEVAQTKSPRASSGKPD